MGNKSSSSRDCSEIPAVTKMNGLMMIDSAKLSAESEYQSSETQMDGLTMKDATENAPKQRESSEQERSRLSSSSRDCSEIQAVTRMTGLMMTDNAELNAESEFPSSETQMDGLMMTDATESAPKLKEPPEEHSSELVGRFTYAKLERQA